MTWFRVPEATVAAAAAAHAQGLRQAEIAKHCGVPTSAVAHLLRAGVNRPRTDGEARKKPKSAKTPKRPPLPVAGSDFIRPPTRAQLMAGR